MATLEQTLKLHDEFSSKLNKVNEAAQETLVVFEKMDGVMNQEVKMTGTEKMESELAKIAAQGEKYTEVLGGIETAVEKLSQVTAKPLIQSQETVQELDAVNQAADQTTNVFTKLSERMDGMRNKAIREPLIEANATVNEMYEITDAVERAKHQLDLLREQRQIQRKEVSLLEAELSKLNESGAGSEAILKLEKALNTANRQLFRHTDAVNRARDNHSQLVIELEHVSSAMDRVGEGRLTGFNNSIQRSITWTQTLIDKVKEIALVAPTEAVTDRLNNGLDRVRGKFSQVRTQIEQSTVGQSRFGQAIQKSAGYATQFMGGLKRGGTDFLNITRRIIGATVKLPFAWMKLIPILGRVINRQRESKQMIDQNTNATNKLGNMVQMVKFGVWVMALRKVYQMVDNIASKLDEMTNTQTRLSVMLDISGSDTSLDEINQQIIASSIDARAAFQDTANFVARVGKTTNIFGETDEIVAFSNLLQKSMRASGSSGEKMKQSMEQVALAMQRGKVEGRELRTLMDGAPLVVKSIADHFNMTTQELTEMAGEGVITAETIKNAMFASADEIEARFAEIPMTWADHWMAVRNVASYAIKPLREAFNEFMNSDAAFTLFEAITAGFVFVAEVATQVFSVIAIGLEWVAANIDKIALGLSLVGSALLIVAMIWAVMHYQVIVVVAIIMWLIDVLHGFGLTAEMVIGFVAGSFMFLAAVIYDVILIAIDLFVTLFQIIANQFITFYNNALAVAEFFMNVWTNPIYSVQMLFYNLLKGILEVFASIVDATGSVGDAIADAFFWGVNAAIKSVNWLMDKLRGIPVIGKLFGSGTISLVTKSENSSSGDNIRALADRFKPTETPEGYNSLDQYRVNPIEVSSIGSSYDGLKNPMAEFNKGYDWGSNLVSGVGDFMTDFDGMVQEENAVLNSMANQMGQAAKGIDPMGGLGDKVGKGKEVGDVGKIKSDVTISDEDLKYLRDIAERNYIIRLQQVSPNATINYNSSGDTEEDAKKLLEMMEDMIVEQVATNLL